MREAPQTDPEASDKPFNGSRLVLFRDQKLSVPPLRILQLPNGGSCVQRAGPNVAHQLSTRVLLPTLIETDTHNCGLNRFGPQVTLSYRDTWEQDGVPGRSELLAHFLLFVVGNNGLGALTPAMAAVESTHSYTFPGQNMGCTRLSSVDTKVIFETAQNRYGETDVLGMATTIESILRGFLEHPNSPSELNPFREQLLAALAEKPFSKALETNNRKIPIPAANELQTA